ncbi:alpha/beta hydrolase [Pontibacillus litoralis]|uniref:Thermostable monoacylglycerol lipase n=1 Tax=Pontibacillus litoralis JSM 072002 TaxID=1385512 RepID=A0A0A5G338_9BACI|nr:alpha/beta fold hydrolase [Pontibacillus litoralis]KGX87506.1 thermostable monoacylglycerol lipase [Pontibacillus litoralis JSM 072002]
MVNDFNVLKGAEPFFYEGDKTGVLVIHGFTGTTQSMHYVGKRLADEGYTVYGPRLTGHGTSPEDMEQATHSDWIRNVQEGVKKLKVTCKEIFVVGLSMGGTLTLYLAQNNPEIKGIMPINAAIHMPELIQTYESLQSTETRFVDGIGSDIKAEGVEELAYAHTPVKSMNEIITLSEQVRNDLEEINIPTSIMYSPEDHVVSPDNSLEIYNSISSEDKQILALKQSYHVATLDNDKDMIADTCIAFINERRNK